MVNEMPHIQAFALEGRLEESPDGVHRIANKLVDLTLEDLVPLQARVPPTPRHRLNPWGFWKIRIEFTPLEEPKHARNE